MLTLDAAVRSLTGERAGGAHWSGELSSSALATATAACALELYARGRTDGSDARRLAVAGVRWIVRNQNADGGWGDTIDSPSNISTTVLAWAVLGQGEDRWLEHAETIARAEAWIRERAGDLTPACLARCLLGVYGDDRTFSIPILTMCALSGRFGEGREAWDEVQQIPFELGAVPHRWLNRIGLPMVSYALPALIAIGQVRHHWRPTRNPLTRLLRNAVRRRTLDVLQRIQPRGGGFLEATPLTSFVTMSLVGCGLKDHPVVERAVRFLTDSVREDGAWPIDTNLATWVTTLSVNALAQGGRLAERLEPAERRRILDWLLDQQYRDRHPYTDAAPGGWAWTDLSGGVPDADDTSGALLALRHLAAADTAHDASFLRTSGAAGVRWLMDLQNRDGGIPTFCRGWGKLPFDRSCPDLTAHAMRAWDAWRPRLAKHESQRVGAAINAGVRYLLGCQDDRGAWTPLWFGNQLDPAFENPLYGTSRVLLAGGIDVPDDRLGARWQAATSRGVDWILAAQGPDGGWGGNVALEPTVEETGLALEALAAFTEDPRVAAAAAAGVEWLEQATAGGERFPTSPMGLYFARLWYSERLYPRIFTVAALERLRARAPVGAAVGQ